jgi:hypothetical protein
MSEHRGPSLMVATSKSSRYANGYLPEPTQDVAMSNETSDPFNMEDALDNPLVLDFMAQSQAPWTDDSMTAFSSAHLEEQWNPDWGLWVGSGSVEMDNLPF